MAGMPSEDLVTRIRAASRDCTAAASGHVFRSPAQAFGDLARACAELGIETWDFYGEGGAVSGSKPSVTGDLRMSRRRPSSPVA